MEGDGPSGGTLMGPAGPAGGANSTLGSRVTGNGWMPGAVIGLGRRWKL